MTTEHIAILCAILGLLAGCGIGYYAGLNVGRAVGWERCRVGLQNAVNAALRDRRDPVTGRYRKAQP